MYGLNSGRRKHSALSRTPTTLSFGDDFLNTNKTAVITGGSSGIGKAAAIMLSDKNYTVFELSRKGESFGKINHITADVTDESAVTRAFEQIIEKTGRIDLLINNAGFGISGAVEFTELESAKKEFDVNFFGTFSCCKAAIPYLRKTKGTIINVSSVAAVFSIPFQSFYSASKSAINSLTLSLANELRTFGIKVCAVMPGDTKTGFTAARQKSDEKNDLYKDTIRSAVTSMEKDELRGMPPESVARLIVKTALKKHPAPIYTAGFKYKLFRLLDRLLPMRLKNYIVGKMYG